MLFHVRFMFVMLGALKRILRKQQNTICFAAFSAMAWIRSVESTPDPNTFQIYLDTPPISIAEAAPRPSLFRGVRQFVWNHLASVSCHFCGQGFWSSLE